MKQLVLRFDVDTPACATSGMRALNDVAADHNVPFVYFVNFGRAVDLVSRFRYRTARRQTGSVKKLGTLEKMTGKELANAVLINPRLADIGRAQFIAADHGRSEIAVHGGRNHGSWQWGYPTWPDQRIESEIAWSHDRFQSMFGRSPVGFSSPGFVADDRLDPVLKRFGYRYRADLHGQGNHQAGSGIVNYATALSGEPGGVGFIEHCLARQLSAADIRQIVTRAIEESPRPVVLYDHPCLAGRRGLALLLDILALASARGWQLVTLAELVDAK